MTTSFALGSSKTDTVPACIHWAVGGRHTVCMLSPQYANRLIDYMQGKISADGVIPPVGATHGTWLS